MRDDRVIHAVVLQVEIEARHALLLWQTRVDFLDALPNKSPQLLDPHVLHQSSLAASLPLSSSMSSGSSSSRCGRLVGTGTGRPRFDHFGTARPRRRSALFALWTCSVMRTSRFNPSGVFSRPLGIAVRRALRQ